MNCAGGIPETADQNLTLSASGTPGATTTCALNFSSGTWQTARKNRIMNVMANGSALLKATRLPPCAGYRLAPSAQYKAAPMRRSPDQRSARSPPWRLPVWLVRAAARGSSVAYFSLQAPAFRQIARGYTSGQSTPWAETGRKTTSRGYSLVRSAHERSHCSFFRIFASGLPQIARFSSGLWNPAPAPPTTGLARGYGAGSPTCTGDACLFRAALYYLSYPGVGAIVQLWSLVSPS